MDHGYVFISEGRVEHATLLCLDWIGMCKHLLGRNSAEFFGMEIPVFSVKCRCQVEWILLSSNCKKGQM